MRPRSLNPVLTLSSTRVPFLPSVPGRDSSVTLTSLPCAVGCGRCGEGTAAALASEKMCRSRSGSRRSAGRLRSETTFAGTDLTKSIVDGPRWYLALYLDELRCH